MMNDHLLLVIVTIGEIFIVTLAVTMGLLSMKNSQRKPHKKTR
jgi:hypothetical protein